MTNPGQPPPSQVFTPIDPAFEQRVRASFARQRVMTTIGAELVSVAPGEVVIALPFREDLTQQHGYLHAAILTAVAYGRVMKPGRTLTVTSGDVAVRGRTQLAQPFPTGWSAAAIAERLPDFDLVREAEAELPSPTESAAIPAMLAVLRRR